MASDSVYLDERKKKDTSFIVQRLIIKFLANEGVRLSNSSKKRLKVIPNIACSERVCHQGKVCQRFRFPRSDFLQGQRNAEYYSLINLRPFIAQNGEDVP